MIGCLVIHGYTGGPHEIMPLTNFLKAHTNWKIHVPTLPGHGENLNLEDTSHQKWLAAAEDALQKLNQQCDEIFVIGFSMGGMIAAYLAAKYKVHKLVLLAPSRRYISLRKMTIEIGEVIVDHFRGELDRNEFYLNYKRKRDDVPLSANIEFLKLVNYTKSYLKELTAPVLIAHGRKDSIVPVSTVHSLDREIASEQKQIVLLDRSTHLLCLGEDKHILNDIVYSFLTEADN